MDPALFAGGLDGGARGVDIGRDTTSQPANDGATHRAGDFPDRFKVSLAGDGKAGLDNVDAEAGQLAGDLQFLPLGHGRTGALLAVAQRRVKNEDPVAHPITLARTEPICISEK